jgi:hypothetical protein
MGIQARLFLMKKLQMKIGIRLTSGRNRAYMQQGCSQSFFSKVTNDTVQMALLQFMKERAR